MVVCPTTDGKKVIDELLGVGTVIEETDFAKAIPASSSVASGALAYNNQSVFPPDFHTAMSLTGPDGKIMSIGGDGNVKGISATNLKNLLQSSTPEMLKTNADKTLTHISLTASGTTGTDRINLLAENMRVASWNGTDLDEVLKLISANMTQSTQNVERLAELRNAREVMKTIGGESFKAINAKTPEELATFLAANGDEIKWMSVQNIQDIAVNPSYGDAILAQHAAEWQKTFANEYKDFFTANADSINDIFKGTPVDVEFSKKLDAYAAQYGSNFTSAWKEATSGFVPEGWTTLTNSDVPISSATAQEIASRAIASGKLSADTPLDAILAIPNLSKTSDLTALAAATRDDAVMQALATKVAGDADAIQILSNLKKLDSVADKVPAESLMQVQSRIMIDGLTGAIDLKYGIYGDIREAEAALKKALGENGYNQLNLGTTWADNPLRSAKSILTDAKLDPTEVYYKLGLASEPANSMFVSSLPNVTDMEMATLKKSLLSQGRSELYKAVESTRTEQTYLRVLAQGSATEVAGFLSDSKFNDILSSLNSENFAIVKDRMRSLDPDVADQLELVRARQTPAVVTVDDVVKQYDGLTQTNHFLEYKKSEAGDDLLTKSVVAYTGKPVTMDRLVASAGDLDAVGNRDLALMSDAEFDTFLKLVSPNDVDVARTMREAGKTELWNEYQELAKANANKLNSMYAGSKSATDAELIKNSSDVAYKLNYLDPIEDAIRSGVADPLDARTVEQIVEMQREVGRVLTDEELSGLRTVAVEEVIKHPDELYRSLGNATFAEQAKKLNPVDLKTWTDDLPEGAATDLVRSTLGIPIEISGLAPSQEVAYIEYVLRNGTVTDIKTMLAEPKYVDSVWQVSKTEMDRFNRLYEGMTSPTYSGIKDEIAKAYNGGVKLDAPEVKSTPSSLLDGTPDEIRTSVGFDGVKVNVPTDSRSAFTKELTELSDLKFEEKIASIAGPDPDLAKALRDARNQELASRSSTIPAIINDPVKNATKLSQELERVGGKASATMDDSNNIVDQLMHLSEEDPAAYDAFMSKLKSAGEDDLYQRLQDATQTEFNISKVEAERLGDVAQAEEFKIEKVIADGKAPEEVASDVKAAEITAEQGKKTDEAAKAVADATTTEEREVAKQAWKKFSSEESKAHCDLLQGDSAESVALRDRIAGMTPSGFDKERSELFNKYGQDGSQLINEYHKIHWEGSDNVKGLADRLLKSDKLSDADREWVTKVGDKLKNPQAYWAKEDTRKFMELVDKVDRGTAYWMMMWAIPNKIRGVGLWSIKHPILAVSTAITISGLPTFFGFILEEGLQAGLSFATYGMDSEQTAAYYEEHGMPLFQAIEDSWSTFGWMMDNVPGVANVFFLSKALDIYVRQVGPAQMIGKLAVLEGVGAWRKSSANGGYGEKTTVEYQNQFILANPSVWSKLSDAQISAKLDLRTDADGHTYIGPNNIFAAGRGLDEETAMRVGEGGFAYVSDTGGTDGFKNFQVLYDKITTEGGSILWDANKKAYLENGNTQESAKSYLKNFDASTAGSGLSSTSISEYVKTDSPDANTLYHNPVTGVDRYGKELDAATWDKYDWKPTASLGTVKPISSTGTDSGSTKVSSSNPSQAMTNDEMLIHNEALEYDKTKYLSTLGKYDARDKSSRDAELKYYTRADGSVDIAKFLGDHPEFSYADLTQMFDTPAVYAGFKAEVSSMSDAEAFKYVSEFAKKNPDLSTSQVANFLPGDKLTAYNAWLENPKNAVGGIVYGADGSMTYVQPDGYTQHKSLLADGKTGVYNPVTGDYSIPFTKTDANTGRVDTFNTSEYAKWLTANPGGNVSDFLATDKAYTCTYKCDEASSSGGSSKGSSGGSSKSSSSSSTGTPGIFIDAGGLKADVSENGEVIGTTDTTIDLEAGTHTLTISKTGYTSRTIVATIKTSVYNYSVTLYKSSGSTTTGTFNHGICTFLEDIGGVGNLTPAMYMLLYYKYKAYITSDAGWKTLYDNLYAQIGGSMGSIPSSIYKDDLLYLYGQMMGDTSTDTLLVKVCPLSS
jgi:hypothetical protein